MDIEHFKLSLALMERVKDEKKPFRMHSWFTRYFEPEDIAKDNGDPNHPCGFAACVGGHMAVDPAHNELDFVLSKYRIYEPFYRRTHDRNFLAIQNFWDCTLEEVFCICSVLNYRNFNPSIHEVINRMKEMLAKHTETVKEPA